MRICFVMGTMCAGGILVSCGFGHTNGSGVKDVGDIVSMQTDGDGKFNVVCKDGRIERAVTDELIKQGAVCKPVPTPTPTPAVVQVNAKAFNALKIWQEGRGIEILDYPQVYGNGGAADGVFSVARETYRQNEKFIGSATEGAKVEGDLLIYPEREGRNLVLRFSAPTDELMGQEGSVRYCKSVGLRLPTVQELFDFCAAGKPKNEDGLYTDNRCQKPWAHWSASWLSSVGYSSAWLFDGGRGLPRVDEPEEGRFSVRCVGPAE